MNVSKRYLGAIGFLLLLGLLPALAYAGVPPFNSLGVFLAANVASILILLVFGVIGGAFVGMLLAHRILANREFTPFERRVMESLEEIRTRLDALEKRP